VPVRVVTIPAIAQECAVTGCAAKRGLTDGPSVVARMPAAPHHAATVRRPASGVLMRQSTQQPVMALRLVCPGAATARIRRLSGVILACHAPDQGGRPGRALHPFHSASGAGPR
jgi:hypothetical protein